MALESQSLFETKMKSRVKAQAASHREMYLYPSVSYQLMLIGFIKPLLCFSSATMYKNHLGSSLK